MIELIKVYLYCVTIKHFIINLLYNILSNKNVRIMWCYHYFAKMLNIFVYYFWIVGF